MGHGPLAANVPHQSTQQIESEHMNTTGSVCVVATEDGPPPLTTGATLLPGYSVVAHLRRGEDLDIYDLWSEERACHCIGKTLRPDRQQCSWALRGLLREGRLLNACTHPHLPRVYGVHATPYPVIIMETLPGVTLARLIEGQGQLTVRDAACLGVHLCSAVQYLHHHGYLHLDIKPSNVIAGYGIAKLLDLSIARRTGSRGHGEGTPDYMAPEQHHRGRLTEATDMWGIGVTLHEALTGAPPFVFDDDQKITEWAFGPPPLIARRLPPPLRQALCCCLKTDPAQRPSARALMDVLTAVAGASR